MISRILTYFLVLVLISTKSFAHRLWYCKADSVVNYSWDNNTWLPSNKTLNYFDFNGNLIQEVNYGFNSISQTWEYTSKINYEYINDGNKYFINSKTTFSWNIQTTNWDSLFKQTYSYINYKLELGKIEKWNSTNQVWENFEKKQYLFPTDTLDNSYESYSWSSNSWVGNKKIIHQINNSGLDLLIEDYTWSNISSDWSGNYRNEFVYSNNNLVNKTVSNWQNNEWIFSTSTNYIYDINNNIVEELYSIYNGNNWINFRKTENEYIANNLLNEINSKWDTISDAWIFQEKTNYIINQYDLNDSIINYLWLNNNWILNTLSHNLFDQWGRDTLTTVLEWDTIINSWDKKTSILKEYNGNDLITIRSYWEPFINDWAPLIRLKESYTTKGKLAHTIFETWDDNSNNWLKISRDSFAYDDLDNEIYEASYYWDDVLNGWVGDVKRLDFIHQFKVKANNPLLSICEYDTIRLNSCDNSIFTHQWFYNSDSLNHSSYELYAYELGEYYSIIQDQNCHHYSEKVNIVDFVSNFSPIIVLDGNTLKEDNGLFVSWYLDGDLIESNTNSISLFESGNYSAEFIDTLSGCIAKSNIFEFINKIINYEEDDYIKINPNVVYNSARVIISSFDYQNELQVFDFKGQLVYSKPVTNNSSLIIDRRDFQSGMYFIKYGNESTRFVIP